jgi:hypothetical protein
MRDFHFKSQVVGVAGVGIPVSDNRAVGNTRDVAQQALLSAALKTAPASPPALD